MGYRRYNYSRQPRQNNPELVARIEKTVAQGATTMTDWERSFLGSLLDSAKKWGRLTSKQHQVFQRIEKKLDPAHRKAREQWLANFTDEMHEKARFAAGYYQANPPYFSDAASRILNDSSYIPTEKLYRKMVENKYVQRAMDNASQAPKYPAGTMAMVRNSQATPFRDLRGKLVMVISVEQDVKSATKGARRLTVLPVGSDKSVNIEERYLKSAKV